MMMMMLRLHHVQVLLLLLSAVILLLFVPCVESFSTNSNINSDSNTPNTNGKNNNSSSNARSPWAPATWIITLELGTAETGSRIVTPITVQVESTSLLQTTTAFDPFVGPGASSIVPQTTGTYISMKGEQRIAFSKGGWTLEFPPSGGKQGLASQLRLWLDLSSLDSETDVERNDVFIKKGERLYFAAKAWREDDYAVGCQRMQPIHQAWQRAQQVLEEKLSHQTGDRRLDGNDPLETLQAYGDMTQLVLDRDMKRQEWLQALEKYPPVTTSSSSLDKQNSQSNNSGNRNGNYNNNNGDDKDDLLLPEGPWPGAEEWITLSNQNNPILVARPKKLLLGQDYEVVGQWTATPVLSEDDYEV
jgi:hypothetical protein